MKQIVEQLLADRRMKLMDQVAGGIREAAAKSQNVLELIRNDKLN